GADRFGSRRNWEVMSTVDRIKELEAEATEAIAAATDTAALEELRVRYLGRKSELTGILRGIGQLPPEERGPVGSEANRVRGALEEALARSRDALAAAELEER